MMQKLFLSAAFGLVASYAGAEVNGAIPSENGIYQIVLNQDLSTSPMREFVELDGVIYTADDKPIGMAQVTVGGGMPAHGHGLPTSPIASVFDDGTFVVKGLKFSMPGGWIVVFDITSDAGVDSVTVDFDL
jgi:hypothetical protein